MPVVKSRFTLKSEDIDKLNQAIARCSESSERVLNEYLHEEVGEQLAKSITKFIPRSKVDKVHAQDSRWWEQENFNLAVGIGNSLKGKRGTSFYYLYYVATGTGTSKYKGPNAFMEDGLEHEYDNIVNGMINKLIQNINKELK